MCGDNLFADVTPSLVQQADVQRQASRSSIFARGKTGQDEQQQQQHSGVKDGLQLTVIDPVQSYYCLVLVIQVCPHWRLFEGAVVTSK